MRKRWRKPLIPAIVALVALGVWAEVRYSRQSNEPPAPGRASDPQAEITATASAAPSAVTSTAQPIIAVSPSLKSNAAEPTPFAPPDEAAVSEVDKISLMLRDYRTIAGENPVGTNSEIMAAVMGENQKQATLGPPEGMQLNEDGELIDRWGTPYFFHQLSRDHMEIRSAGADKVLWTDDDPVMK